MALTLEGLEALVIGGVTPCEVVHVPSLILRLRILKRVLVVSAGILILVLGLVLLLYIDVLVHLLIGFLVVLVILVW